MMCASHCDYVQEDDGHDQQLKGCGVDAIEDETSPGVLRWNVMPNWPCNPEIPLSDHPLFLLLRQQVRPSFMLVFDLMKLQLLP